MRTLDLSIPFLKRKSEEITLKGEKLLAIHPSGAGSRLIVVVLCDKDRRCVKSANYLLSGFYRLIIPVEGFDSFWLERSGIGVKRTHLNLHLE